MGIKLLCTVSKIGCVRNRDMKRSIKTGLIGLMV
jgi:hypothetical protein